jgi:hypothetical protein
LDLSNVKKSLTTSRAHEVTAMSRIKYTFAMIIQRAQGRSTASGYVWS